MADDTSVQATEDTSVSEAVDTSTNVETHDTDVDLEDIEVNLDELDDDDTNESEETSKDTAATESEAEESLEAEDDGEQSQTVEEDTNSAAEKKRHNDEMAKQRIAERAARQEAEQAKAALEATHLEQYLQEAGDDEVEIAKRQLDVQAYKLQQERIDINADRLQSGIEKAAATIDLFQTGSDEVKEELLNALDDFERFYVVKDKQGRPIEVNGDVYQYLQAKAESIKRLTGVGAREETKAKNNAKARTSTIPTRAPKEPPKDTDLEDFDSGWQ